MADFGAGFDRIAAVLSLSDMERGAARPAYAARCGPCGAAPATAKARAHRATGGGRAGRLGVLREVDGTYLGGRLAAANASLRASLE